MKLTKKISILLAITLVVSSTNTIKASSEDKLVGLGRYETAIKISQSGWEKSNKVVIVNDSAIADALAVTPFAEAENAPILLSKKEKLNSKIKSELKRLEVKKVYLIGGEAVLSKNIEAQLKVLNIEVERIYGENRYLTALEIAKRLDKVKDIEEIAVVNGTTGLSDAVSIGSVAARDDMAIILSNNNYGTLVSDEFIKNEDIKTSYIIGGEYAVSKDVENNLPNPIRIHGIDRNETNSKVIEVFYSQKDLENIYVTKNGMNREDYLIDALAVGVLAAKNNSPVMIVGNNLNQVQTNMVNTKSFKSVTQVGGRGNEKAFKTLKEIQSSSTFKVTTIDELNYALAKADANDIINIESLYGAIHTNEIEIKSNKAIRINLYDSSEKSIIVDLKNGTLVAINSNNIDIKSGNLLINENIETLPTKKEKTLEVNNESIVNPNKNGVYEINNSNQLSWISEFVNSGNTNISIKLKNNINLNNKEWTPIGTKKNPFKGSFDGGNYEINNLNINKEESSNLGLFGVVSNRVKIKNIKLDNVNIKGYEKIGSLVGTIINEKTSSKFEEIIENCFVKNVNLNCEKGYVGGLVGYGQVNMKKCSVEKVNITTDINLVKGHSVGGAIGYVASNSILNNVKASNLNLNGTRQIGGIAGCVEGSQTLVKNCKVEKTSVNAEGVLMEGYYPYAGGLVGEVLTNSVSIRNSSIDKKTVSISGNNSELLGLFVGGNKNYHEKSFKSEIVKLFNNRGSKDISDNDETQKVNNGYEDIKEKDASLFAVDAKFSDKAIEVGVILYEDIDLSSLSKDNITVSYLDKNGDVIKSSDKSCEGYLKDSNGKSLKKLNSGVRYFIRENSLKEFENLDKIKISINVGNKVQNLVLHNTIMY